MALLHVAAAAAGIVFWRTVLNQDNTYVFPEYVMKFVPALLDHGVGGWFDTWAMGDPRPRLVTVMATRLSIELRGWLSSATTLPPAFGLGWFIYPACLTVLYRLLRRLTGDRRVALGGAILWGLSPPALDSLVFCYVPAKALMNLLFPSALLMVAKLGDENIPINQDPARPQFNRTALGLGVITLLALLTDETAWFIFLCAPCLFPGILVPFVAPGRLLRKVWMALLAPAFVFVGIALVAYPAINREMGQVPLNFISAAIGGPSVALIGAPGTSIIASSHFVGRLENFQPLGLIYTLLTAHLIPGRVVPGFYASSSPLNPADWPLTELGILLVFFAAVIAFAAQLQDRQRSLAMRFGIAVVALIIGYAFLLIPLGPAILEVNYYGALFSIFFACTLSLLVLGSAGSSSRGLWAVGVIALLAVTEWQGYEQTAARIRKYLSATDHSTRDWTSLNRMARQVAAGNFARVAIERPYPSRDFLYAFDLEAWRQHREGRKVDFLPYANPATLYDVLLATHIRYIEEFGHPLANPDAKLTEDNVRRSGGIRLSGPEVAALIHGHTWHGATRNWTFTRQFDENGRYLQRYWLNEIMRIWCSSGESRVGAEGTLDLQDSVYGKSRIVNLYNLHGRYFGFTASGEFVCSFTQIAPVDL